jgi:O-succinylbenzoic acid--CoA ligase
MKEFFNGAFTLNGVNVGYGDLGEVAYSLVKEGDPYEQEIGDFLLDWVSDREDIRMKTSGSTGAPGVIHMPKKTMVHSALATGKYLGLEEGTRALLCLPARSIAGKMMLVRALVLGWKLVLKSPDSDPLRGLLRPVDFAAMVPMQLEASLKNKEKISTILVGGAPLSRALLSRIPEDGISVYESYGMTETASHIALRKLCKVPEGKSPESVLPPFQVLPGVEISKDDRGCLLIKAPYLPEKTVATNDLVALETDDTFRWLGRADHVVNSGGVKLIPEQLEEKLSALILQPFFLAGMPDETLGEKLVLMVEGTRDDSLLQKIKESSLVDRYEVPREIRFLKAFSQTPTGKVNRRETLRNSHTAIEQ